MPLVDLTLEELRFIGSVLLDAPLPMRSTHPIMEKIETARVAGMAEQQSPPAAVAADRTPEPVASLAGDRRDRSRQR